MLQAEITAAIAQILLLLAAIAGLFMAARQSREASRSRRLAATKLLLDEIGNDAVVEARVFVMERMPNLSPDELGDLSEQSETVNYIRRVGRAYDRIGILVKQGLLSDDVVYSAQNVEIRSIWDKIKPVVDSIRQRRGRPNYFFHFEWLAVDWLPHAARRQGSGSSMAILHSTGANQRIRTLLLGVARIVRRR